MTWGPRGSAWFARRGSSPDTIHEIGDLWLDALREDAPQLSIPSGAVYGPLLAVETNPERRARIVALAGMLNRTFKVIQHRDNLLKQTIIGKAERIFLLTLMAFTGIFQVSPFTQVKIPVVAGLRPGGIKFIF